MFWFLRRNDVFRTSDNLRKKPQLREVDKFDGVIWFNGKSNNLGLLEFPLSMKI